MLQKRYTERQVVTILKEHEAGTKTQDLRRKYGVNDYTLYSLRAKFAGMTVTEVKREQKNWAVPV